jgi:hypothetical protein
MNRISSGWYTEERRRDGSSGTDAGAKAEEECMGGGAIAMLDCPGKQG